MFVLCMRQDYQEKRKTFRQIIDVHKAELEEKEKYWNEMLMVSSSVVMELVLQEKRVKKERKKEKKERKTDVQMKIVDQETFSET